MTVETQAQLDQLILERKELSRAIGRAKSAGEDATALLERAREVSAEITRLQQLNAEPMAVASQASPLRADVLRQAADIMALADSWRALQDANPSSSPYMSWEWLASWCETYGARQELRCITVWDGDDRLVGLAPLCVAQSGSKTMPAGTLGFMASDTRSWGYHGEFLTAPDRHREVFTLILDVIMRLRPEWQALHLVRMVSDGPTVAGLAAMGPAHGLNVAIMPDYREVYEDLPPTYEDFLARLPSGKRRRELRRHEKRLADEFCEICLVELVDQDEVGPWLETLGGLSNSRFMEAGRMTNFLDEDFVRCWHLCGERLFARGQLQGTAMLIDGRVVAMRLGYLHHETCYLVQPAFAPEFGPYRVSHLLLAEHIKRAFATGIRHICAPGAERPHTAEYIGGRRQAVTVTAAPGGWRETWSLTRGPWRRTLRATAKRLLRRGTPPPETPKTGTTP